MYMVYDKESGNFLGISKEKKDHPLLDYSGDNVFNYNDFILGKKVDDPLDFNFYCDDLDCSVTIRQYLKSLLQRLWVEGESFSSKRPFGNSGWYLDLRRAVVMSGAIDGKITFDDEGWIESDVYDREAADEMVLELIKRL